MLQVNIAKRQVNIAGHVNAEQSTGD